MTARAAWPAAAARPTPTNMILALRRSDEISATARTAVRSFAERLGERRTADACLLVSELVTNAYCHGRGQILLRIAVQDHAACFAVQDEGDAVLRLTPDPGQYGGWGLNIVASVADRWGTGSAPTHVWFELAPDAGRVTESPVGLSQDQRLQPV